MSQIKELWVGGGPFMWAILIVFTFALAIIIERMMYIFGKARVNAKRFMSEIMKLVQADMVEKAIALCANSPAPLPRMVRAVLQKHDRTEREMQNAVDEVALEEIPRINQRTHYLAALGNISTLIGLLGTIFGLIAAFKAVGAASAADKSKILSQGISMAMSTTAFGLIVAIPCLLFYSIIQGRVEKVVDDIDEYSVKLINLLAAIKR